VTPARRECVAFEERKQSERLKTCAKSVSESRKKKAAQKAAYLVTPAGRECIAFEERKQSERLRTCAKSVSELIIRFTHDPLNS